MLHHTNNETYLIPLNPADSWIIGRWIGPDTDASDGTMNQSPRLVTPLKPPIRRTAQRICVASALWNENT